MQKKKTKTRKCTDIDLIFKNLFCYCNSFYTNATVDSDARKLYLLFRLLVYAYHRCAVTLITNPLYKAVKSVTCLEVGKAVEGGKLMKGTVESLFQYHPIIFYYQAKGVSDPVF